MVRARPRARPLYTVRSRVVTIRFRFEYVLSDSARKESVRPPRSARTQQSLPLLGAGLQGGQAHTSRSRLEGRGPQHTSARAIAKRGAARRARSGVSH
eukprot:5177828-Prymnesium_polylepis.1